MSVAFLDRNQFTHAETRVCIDGEMALAHPVAGDIIPTKTHCWLVVNSIKGPPVSPGNNSTDEEGRLFIEAIEFLSESGTFPSIVRMDTELQ